MGITSCDLGHRMAAIYPQILARNTEAENASCNATLQSLREGERVEWERLFRRMERRCLALAWRILNDSHLAADAVQEGWLKAYRNRSDLGPHSRAEHWLLATVANAARDAVRARVRDESARERLVSRSSATYREEPGTNEMEEPLREALGRLDESTRLVFLLVHQEGLSYRQVADEFGWPIGTVRSRLHRARQTLRSMLKHEEGAP